MYLCNLRLSSYVVYFLLLISTVFGAEYSFFRPDARWLDNNDVHINAHGGGILDHENVYYWFGEHKVEGRRGNFAQVGVHCYSSTDLYNWKDEGIALSVSNDPASEIVKGSIIERPKVIFNKKTGKFVMWFHLELKGQSYNTARAGIAASDTVTGPYTYIRSVRPNAGHWPINVTEEQKDPESIARTKAENDNFSGGPEDKHSKFNILGAHFEGGQMSRDMTLFIDNDGKAYHIYASEHNSTMHIAQLTDDYLDHSGRFVRVFPLRWMEAPAICKWDGKYYLIASGCTGWAPNAARSAVAENILGPWKELGNPCTGVNPHNDFGPEKTFGGQSTYLLPVRGKQGAFIAMFDVWAPWNPIEGRYIWLPVSFKDDRIIVTWQDEWDLSIFSQSK